MNDVNGMIGGSIPSWGSPTLEGLEFENSGTPGVLKMKSSGRQHVKFRWENTYNPFKAKSESGVIDTAKGMEKKLFVKIVTPGDKTEYDGLAEDYHKRAYFRQYQAFKEGRGAPEGQSVEDCEFILAPEAIELLHMQIHTVEQLAEAADIAVEQLPRGFELREHARAWCKATHGNALVLNQKKLGADLNEAKDVISKQAKMLEDMQRQMAEMRTSIRKSEEAQMEAEIAESVIEIKGKKK